MTHLLITLRLHFRNRMALVYSYLFPAIFLLAFWVLYRHERVPLVRHMGELLTVTVLGSACFGLPTSIVSERERGVWRRYRLAPVSTGRLVATTTAARYLILLTAGALQLALAMGLGMPWPRHPFDLWVVFTLVAFAFIGLGLVIAMTADTVPAVQALGQCVFLPMLIIGGVAVPLASLPEWAQHVSAFFPGRYAVEALHACVAGGGLGATPYSLIALAIIGAAGAIAGAKLFRWDAETRFAAQEGRGWIAVALAAWVAVGVIAEARGGVLLLPPLETTTAVTPQGTGAVPRGGSAPAPAEETPPAPEPVRPPAPEAGSPAAAAAPTPRPSSPGADTRPAKPKPGAAPQPEPSEADTARPLVPTSSRSWRDVTAEEIDREIAFER
ncbi:MAG TPA: ABC transporter permease, partial [Vicinamibacterales bacterium]|nr:ABC transporter permease [Vicinamibacterales bacterium]